ncbi:MAG: RNA polymerase sigma factor [Acidobacteria bacterium]|nr:RNA polymerase sigma factor [Acidobacteriota bacterium]
MPAWDDNLSETALLRRLQGGEEMAFELLYERYQPRVYRYVLRMCGRPETADDVVQEVFLSLIRGRESYSPRSGALGSYLYGMARNLMFRQVGEAAGREPEEDDSVTEYDPLEGMNREEQVEQVRQALRALPAHYREVVVLCDMEEMGYAEAAEALGVAVGTVRSRLHRARALLLERLSEERCRA